MKKLVSIIVDKAKSLCVKLIVISLQKSWWPTKEHYAYRQPYESKCNYLWAACMIYIIMTTFGTRFCLDKGIAIFFN
jgi:hypothetical protein